MIAKTQGINTAPSKIEAIGYAAPCCVKFLIKIINKIRDVYFKKWPVLLLNDHPTE